MDRTRGFTLIEAMLVITIGAVLLASGTLMYGQYRRTVAEANAMQKTMAFQGLIETMAGIDTNTGAGASTYPWATPLAAAWQAKRPNDWDKSPWGGMAVVNNVASAFLGNSDVWSASTLTTVTVGANDSGCLHYYRGRNAMQKISAVDNTGNNPTTVSYSGYLIAFVGVPGPGQPTSFSYVRGARVATSSTLEGTIESGDTGAPSDPW